MKILMAICLALPAMALAQEQSPPPSGMSDQTFSSAPATRVNRLLQRQARTPPPEQGELSAGLYVDSQKRIGETFRRPIAQPLGTPTTGGN
ncbi:MAG: hypothetical protein LAT63_07345 [Marinobacter sp.]|nr:hypothetical protein [Marinobacter sp.]